MNARHCHSSSGPKEHLFRRWPWLCPVLSLALAAATLLLLGLSVWTVILLAVLLACPVVTVWTLIIGQRPLPVPLGPVPETRGTTLNWLAPYYDGLSRALGLGRAFRSRTIALAALRPGDRVLDVGCGTGVLTRAAAEAVGPAGRAVGIDAAPDMIRVARENAGLGGSAARFQLAAVERLPFEGHSFDVVLASLVLHHLPSDLKRDGLREIYRVLKPGGRLVVVDFDRPESALGSLLLWPLRLMPTAADHLQGSVLVDLRDVGFHPVEASGRWWLGLLTFWTAGKPADAEALDEMSRWEPLAPRPA